MVPILTIVNPKEKCIMSRVTSRGMDTIVADTVSFVMLGLKHAISIANLIGHSTCIEERKNPFPHCFRAWIAHINARSVRTC